MNLSFTWPWLLLSLLAVPVIVWSYVRLRRTQRRRRQELAAQGLVGPAPTRAVVAPALLLLGVTLSLLAMARPVATVPEPRREGTIMVVVDVSNSMAATDVSPTRLDVAKQVAKGLVDAQGPEIRIGVVAFGDASVVVQQPTTDHTLVLAAVDRLKAGGATAIGSGVLMALSTIAGAPIQLAASPADTQIGWYGGTAIVVLSDGEQTGGPDPADLADLASTAGVRVSAVGIGTTAGTTIKTGGFQVATALDESTLRTLADTTGGTYVAASDSAAIAGMAGTVKLGWTARAVPHEVTSLVVAAAAVLVLVGAAWSIVRTGRVV
ncbi:MAG TPA: VWA domain-containing protein [Propionibacteriaceae bacterium]|nr:VWA domain-containing protein [Propionibacteriaceae bacterium]